MTNLQREAERAVLASWGPLRLVVGEPGRALAVRPGIDPRPRRRTAFTLLELLLVLALLAMAVAIAAPALSRFFRGRALDNEARRMLALTRYGQSRAVSEGIPMVMWFKPDEGTYGLEAEMTYTETDDKAVEYHLDSNLSLELAPATGLSTTPWKITTQIAGNQPAIRFTPDGFIADTSPAWILLKVARDDEPDCVWLAQTENRLNYELQNTQPR
ncbi:MAG TPA: GspH/FimT family pseudopilin [Verrucomicrobiae bacterium]|nr:GspH/FimT family pseudopilin [Verrucomicrobiae bacterium]